MTEQTLTRADLAEAVCNKIGLSRQESADLIEQVLEEICQALIEDESVKISSFGSLTVRAKAERVGRNPKTGVEAAISPRKVLSFKASQLLKDKINGDKAS